MSLVRLIRSAMAPLLRPTWLAERGLMREIGHLLREVRLAGDQVWLDVGCGERPYQALLAEVAYVGLDVQTSGRPGAMKRPDVTYDGRRLPVKRGSVDGVLCTQVLEHVARPEAFINEIADVLRPGGTLVMSVPLFWQEHETPYDFRRYTSFGIRLLMEEHGFEVVQIRKSSGALEALAQGFSVFAFENLRLPIRGFGRLVALVVCGPVQLLGALLGAMLPDQGNLYLDLVVMARRRSGGGAP